MASILRRATLPVRRPGGPRITPGPGGPEKALPPMTPQFDTYGVLHCPCCHNPDTHQFMVAVFARKEDQQVTITAIPTGGEAPASFVLPPNPSMRRDGVAVGFTCEHCPAVFWVSLAQHKGATLLAVSQ